MSPEPAGPTRHAPVMLMEVMAALRPAPGAALLDGTLGGGGHAEAFLERAQPGGRLLGVDQDPAAVARSAARLARFGDQAVCAVARFDRWPELPQAAAFDGFDGALFDLGFSSDQVDDPARGLSFRQDGPLDMRLAAGGGPTAEELVNTLPEAELADLIYRYGEEPASRRIARAIVQARPLGRTVELATVIASAVGPRPSGRSAGPRTHPATRTFQALRIAVNDELGPIAPALDLAVSRLRPGGRLAVISFHSLEDRIVKQTLRRLVTGCTCPPELRDCVCVRRPSLRLVDRRPVVPAEAESQANPRARSARLRTAEKLEGPLAA